MLSAINLGRSIDFVNGINGINAGNNLQINFATNKRMHRVVYQFSAVNYTGGTLQATKHLTGAGNDALVGTVAVSATQVPLTFTVTTAGSGYGVGDTFTTVDATGTGAIFTVATISGSTVLTATYVANSATASPINPGAMCGAMKISVNGVNMRDISPAQELMICQANGVNPQLGELPIFFTEPWRNVVRNNEAQAWDLFAQSTFQMQFFINPGYLLPNVFGVQEWDYQRNVKMQAGKQVLTLDGIIAKHAVGLAAAAGQNNFNIVPFDFPVLRLWLIGATPGQISQFNLKQDGNLPLEAFNGTIISGVVQPNQLKQIYAENGFKFGQPDYVNQTQTAKNPIGLNPVSYFDAAFISDPDQRYWKTLKVKGSMVLQVTSAIAQQITCIVESLPGSYTGA